MKWSLRLGKVAGIGVYIHATFFLMIGWVALSHWMQETQSGRHAAGRRVHPDNLRLRRAP